MNAWLNPLPYTLAYTPHGQRSNQQFNAAAASLSDWLQAQPGSEVTLYCQDAYWFSIGLFGTWLAGKTAHLPGDEITLRQLAHPLILTDLAHIGATMDSLVDAGHVHPAAIAIAPKPASQLILYTSGSTGEPKPVIKTYAQLQIEIQSLEALFGETLQDSVIISTVSHQHLYGLLFRALWPLHTGRAFESETSFYPEQWLEKTLRHQRVAYVASPAHYKRFCKQMPWQELSPHLSAMFSSAGMLASDTAAELKANTGICVTEIFGSTETGGVAWRNAAQSWQAMPNVLTRSNSSRALEIRSPHLGHSDWHTMDDSVIFDGMGHFVLTGRLDRIVKVEEKRVALATVEAALRALAAIDDAAVLLSSRHNRQFLRAFVVLNASAQEKLQTIGKHAFIQALKQQLQDVIEPLAIPRQWRFIDTLPTDAQGKVVQRLLQQEFDQSDLSPSILNTEIAENQFTLTLHVHAETAYFEGHFPEHPVLPGVTQIHWAVKFARLHFDLPEQFRKMEAVKFQRVIVPDSVIKLDLEWDPTKQRLKFAFHSASGPHSSGRLTFQA